MKFLDFEKSLKQHALLYDEDLLGFHDFKKS